MLTHIEKIERGVSGKNYNLIVKSNMMFHLEKKTVKTKAYLLNYTSDLFDTKWSTNETYQLILSVKS